jgi:hypothetical protein
MKSYPRLLIYSFICIFMCPKKEKKIALISQDVDEKWDNDEETIIK